VDDLIDTARQGVSLAVREMCCRVGMDAASFKRAAENLKRIGPLKLSDESLRKAVESEGRTVLGWQDHEQLELDFDAGQCATAATADRRPTTRVYVGIDGFLLPMVSDGEMSKRFEGWRKRRRALRRKRGVRRPKAAGSEPAVQGVQAADDVRSGSDAQDRAGDVMDRRGREKCFGRWLGTCTCAAPGRRSP
jgi:hypothetical protein